MLAEAFVTSPLRREFNVEESFSGRRWRMRARDDDAVRALRQATNVSPLLADLLLARGVTAAEVSDYLTPTLKRLLPEPFLLADMYKAVERVRAAVERGEQIA